MPNLIAALLPFLGFMMILLVGVGLVTLFAPKRVAIDRFPYQEQNSLFTPAERSFLGLLQQAAGDQLVIFGKVQLADVIRVKSGLVGSAHQSAFRRIQGKHLDYVVCDPVDYSIRFVVELDDWSHAQSDEEERDAFIDQALQAAGVKLFRFSSQRDYSIQELRNELFPPESKFS
jgi:hypothetical protein